MLATVPAQRVEGPAARVEGKRVSVIIVREMVGLSPDSWSDAARRAVEIAAKTVRNIEGVEVVKSTADVEDGEIVRYRVALKISFRYDDGEQPGT